MKKREHKKESVEPISMIDMIFILLTFFLVNSMMKVIPPEEQAVNLPTPQNIPGRANTVLQFIDSNTVFWLDENASEVVNRTRRLNHVRFLRPVQQVPHIVDHLLDRFTLQINTNNDAGLNANLNHLMNRANNNPEESMYLLIRCPNDLPYQSVLNVINKIKNSKYKNVDYGCVGGKIDDIRNCSSIATYNDNGREYLQLNF